VFHSWFSLIQCQCCVKLILFNASFYHIYCYWPLSNKLLSERFFSCQIWYTTSCCIYPCGRFFSGRQSRVAIATKATGDSSESSTSLSIVKSVQDVVSTSYTILFLPPSLVSTFFMTCFIFMSSLFLNNRCICLKI